MKINTKAGFTLIEIIIAMTLIAIFVTIPVFAYSSFTRSSRDTQRKNDINKIQGALEQYRANNGKYPPKETWLEDLVSGGYLPEIPTDPRDGQTVGDDSNLLYGYAYEVSDDGQTFQLTSLLENTEEGGPANAGEKSVYVVNPEGPKVAFTTPGAVEDPILPTATGITAPTLAFVSRTPTPTYTPSPTNTLTPTNTPTPTPRNCWGINGNCDTGCVVTNVYAFNIPRSCTQVAEGHWVQPSNNKWCQTSGYTCENGSATSQMVAYWNSGSCNGSPLYYAPASYCWGPWCSTNGTGQCFAGTNPRYESFCYNASKNPYTASCSLMSGGCGQGTVFGGIEQCQWQTLQVWRATNPTESYYNLDPWTPCSTNGTGTCHKLSNPVTYYYDSQTNPPGNCGSSAGYHATKTQCTWYAD